jgi:hypothetical protein
VNQLRDEVHVAFVGAELVQPDDPGMVQPRGGARLALDLAFGVGVAVARDHLHRDLALELLVARLPDDAEAARAEPATEPVAAEHEMAAGVRQPLGGARLRVRRQPHGRALGGAAGVSHLGHVFGSASGLPADCGPCARASPRSDTVLPTVRAVILSPRSVPGAAFR